MHIWRSNVKATPIFNLLWQHIIQLLALEEETRKKKSTNAAEKEVAAERTYEWIHTQVGSTEMEHSERQGSGGHQLPYMDKRLLDGGRTQLVVSANLLPHLIMVEASATIIYFK